MTSIGPRRRRNVMTRLPAFIAIGLAASAIAGCRGTDPETANRSDEPSPKPKAAVRGEAPPAAVRPVQEQAAAPAKAVAPAVDPAGAEAAAQVVQHVFDLVRAGRHPEARRLFEDGGASSGRSEAELAAYYRRYRGYGAVVLPPGPIEGAAGSRYVEVPFLAGGRLADGTLFRQTGRATLRRVAEVPGATAEQRRWHIQTLVFDPIDTRPTSG